MVERLGKLMNKAYQATTWENTPSTASPIDEINLNAISRGLSLVDDRVISNYNDIQGSIRSVSFNGSTGAMVFYRNDGSTIPFNVSANIYSTINANKASADAAFAQVAVNFRDVQDLLDEMDLKIDNSIEGANAGIEELRTTITENDGYYRREMTGIRTEVADVADGNQALYDGLNTRFTTFQSSITQTTNSIQLSVQAVSTALNEDYAVLSSQINQTAGSIALKVSKLEVIDDLQQEFGSGIEITPDCITFASTGAMVVNTDNFKLDEEGNAEFKGHVAMDSGSVGGVPIIASPNDSDTTLSVQHAHHAWKLRSAAVDANDERYYAYITANKNLIVTNSENGGHTANNDRTDDCSVGSYKYPWGKGYFNLLRVQHHDVIPEGLPVTLVAGSWVQHTNGYFTQTLDINGMSGEIYLYVATNNGIDLDLVYRHEIEVDSIQTNKVTFLARTEPQSDIGLILLVEDYILSSIENPVLRARFDQELNQLSCNWSSPRDSSKFITWIKDELVIEHCIDEENPDDPASWEEILVVPTDIGGEPFDPDEFEDTPLVIGSEDE